ncbi:hypothetical protein GBF35_50590 [Nonomuraea phyllanthi]|uniref:hypothetical protein n=1 Tax=Nonomuraea phyllanthi TaxID=2219224 RepID=UPI0012931ADB|nr:hypothetical protein [Nonomuraea phyllanthi]QFY13723.1 hypothetical protein GBF35_50590 [Nonomuraea phyllanthi]
MLAPNPARAAQVEEEPFDYTWTSASIKTVRDQAREAHRLKAPNAALSAAREEFIKHARAKGHVYSVDEVDVFELTAPLQRLQSGETMERSLIVAAPKSYELQYVRRAEDKGAVIVVADGMTTTSGPQAGDGESLATWNPTDGGQYIITITLGGQWIGKMLTMWQTQKIEDSSKTANWHGFSSKSIAEPNEDLEGRVTDYEIGYMRLRTDPRDRDTFQHPVYLGGAWQDIQPATPFTGRCSEQTLNLAASFGPVGLEVPVSFRDCDDYKPIIDYEYPGTYMLEMTQGSWLGDGPRELGYALSLKTDTGVNLRYNQGQILRLIDQAGTTHNVAECSWSGQDHTCEVLDEETRRAQQRP